ncbi:MAG: tRNA threonylcarbamoyladenosine dehydratase [Candidatus Delongbacteria bacterium]|nr:tRNA threonylcarbamoyladenosine dehydratase [Candidatus Delongbacteria bacterium]MBN2835367.1 tRNA threonylcarbamoyladenosine dehydratase [Candidatus Delongbacteria bacterium]
MKSWKERTILAVGESGMTKLENSSILICGVGGVGSWAAEMIARAGVGEITIVDNDTVDVSNINRQMPALHKNIGKLKVDVVKERLMEINPELRIHTFSIFIEEASLEQLFIKKYDYIVDAIDSITPKVLLIKKALDNNIPIVSSMGAGAKFDPLQIKVEDISKTKICPLARIVRTKLKSYGVYKGFKAIYSTEPAKKEAVIDGEQKNYKRSVLGTISYLPSTFGMVAASVVIRDLIKAGELFE